MVNRFADQTYEEAGRRIYESQQARLSDQTSFAAKRGWRSPDVPEQFWDNYCADARAALTSRRFTEPTARGVRDEGLTRTAIRRN